jgi:hypothetical protein
LTGCAFEILPRSEDRDDRLGLKRQQIFIASDDAAVMAFDGELQQEVVVGLSA